ncbi:MAG: hypothetical protein C0514_01735 [Candidatus Puniceispirillum sp.]|nr:hypothetical protein [Candidatus Puniceispirillum sp.]
MGMRSARMWVFLAFCATPIAQASDPGEALAMEEGGAQVASLIHGAREGFAQAHSAFNQSHAPGDLESCLCRANTLLQIMESCNDQDTQRVGQACVASSLLAARERVQDIIQNYEVLLKKDVRAHCLPPAQGVSTSQQETLERIMTVYHKAHSTAFHFAAQSRVQTNFYSEVIRARMAHYAWCKDEAWQDFEKCARHKDLLDPFLTLFWNLERDLQELLLITHGDKSHAQWSPRLKTIGLQKQIDPSWRAIVAMETQDLKGALLPLVALHDAQKAAVEARQDVMDVRVAFKTWNDYSVVFQAVASLFWDGERVVIHEGARDHEEGAPVHQGRQRSLLIVWSAPEKDSNQRANDALFERLKEVMIKRFALTLALSNNDRT